MIYILSGENSELKEKHLSELKKKYFPDFAQGDVGFDYEVLYGNKLDSLTLKKALVSLPALAKERLVIIREGHNLSEHNLELISEYIQSKEARSSLVLESDSFFDDDFIKGLKPDLKMIDCSTGGKFTVFDMTREMSAGRCAEALKILHILVTEQDVHPLQILGVLVWFWGKERGRLDKGEYKEGLLALQEADINIKRSRLDPVYAVEVLIVKLCS